MTPRWDRNFLNRCLLIADMSKDPSTKVGAILTQGEPGVQIADGFNGLPRGIADTFERLNNRDLKYKLVVHAERNAIINAARLGISTIGATLYVAGKDAPTGAIWGRWCCSACAIEVIQAGIKRIVWPAAITPLRWEEDALFSEQLLREAGVAIKEIPLP